MANKRQETDGDSCVLPLTELEKDIPSTLKDQQHENKPNFKRDVDLIPKDTGWAWMCCLGNFIQNSLTVGAVSKTFSVFYVPFMEHFNSGAGTAAWIVVLVNASLLAGGSFTNALAMRFGAKIVVIVGGIFVSLGYITSMFATQLEHLFLTYGLLGGIGCAMAWSVSMAHMGLYFKKRRAIANSLGTAGVGIGNFVLPPIIRLLLDTYGLQGALLVMAGITLNICVAGSLMRPPSAYRPKTKSQGNTIYTKHNKENNQAQIDFDEKQKCTAKERTISRLNFCKNVYNIYASLEWSLLKKLPFLLHGISMTLYMSGFPSYFIATPPHAEQIGHSKTNAAYLVSVAGLAELVGRIATGLIADTRIIPTPILMAVILFLGSVTASLTPFVTDFIPLAFMVFFYALFAGPVISLNPVLIAESFGAARLPSGLGILGLFLAAGVVPSAPVAGTLRDTTGNWNSSFYYCAATLFLSGIVMLMRQLCLKPNESKHVKQTK